MYKYNTDKNVLSCLILVKVVSGYRPRNDLALLRIATTYIHIMVLSSGNSKRRREDDEPKIDILPTKKQEAAKVNEPPSNDPLPRMMPMIVMAAEKSTIKAVSQGP